MQKLVAAWTNLDTRRRVVAGLAALAVFATIVAMSRVASTAQMRLLYSGLDSSAAGEVVQALEARAIPYEVRGDAIFVDGALRDSLRMTLASEGLPASGTAGYELLDSLSGFGTTSQMFDAAYWRAKEGELARTIVASPGIRAARVHIASTTGQPFRRDLKPSAAVTVTTVTGRVSREKAEALKYLVASSVAGLAPENVSVIDAAGGLVANHDESDPSIAAADRAAMLENNVRHLLEAFMGPGRAVVEVSVEAVRTRQSLVERRVDPESQVAISSETSERTVTSSDQGGGAVTVASNLPANEAGGDRRASRNESRTDERVNFDVSETTREVTTPAGAVKRLTVAILLDGTRTTDANGNPVWSPLPDTKLEEVKELVASAVGFNADRGDVITVKSMQFEQPEPRGTLVKQSMIDRLDLNIMALIQIAALSLVALVLGLFVLRPILAGRSASGAPGLPALERRGDPAEAALTGEIDDGALPEIAINSASDVMQAAADQAALSAPSADPVDRLRHLIEDRGEETVQILRDWMEADEERT